MDELLLEFIAETRETLEAVSGEIVAWEADPGDRARLDAIFRFVHTVKGSCGFLDLPRLLRLSHAAEDVLADVREGTRRPDTALVNAVLAIVDRIGQIVEAIAAGASLDDSGEDLLIAALEQGAEPAAVVPAPVVRAGTGRSVRLSVDLLDRMMSGMSEMVLARNELSRRLRDTPIEPAIEAALARLSTTVGDMRETVTRTRMQTIEALFSALPRIVRDTAAGVGKSVDLVVDGAEVELDREMIELMRDPLVHMVRNAIDHGIEDAAARRAAGKRVAGRLTVSARQSGNRIIVEIGDDGAGIDTARLVAKVAARQPARAAELAAMSERQRLDLIFEAGVSSRDCVTEMSGRGVGMDVVRANIEQIGGRIELHNTPGRGLTVVIHVPLTLAILPTVVVEAGGQTFAVPRQGIEEIVAVNGAAVRIERLGDAAVASVRGRRMALVELGAVLGLHEVRAAGLAMLMIVDVPGGTYALGIDAVCDTEELVVKPAAPAVMATGTYAGQTLPDSGLPMLMIDLAGVAAVAGVRFDRAIPADEAEARAPVRTIPSLLFRDLDGRRRAIALSVVDRVERVEAAAIAVSGGRLRMMFEGRTVPLSATAAIGDGARVAVIRISDGATEAGYVVAEALEIVALPDEIVPCVVPGPICGVVAHDGAAIELVDPLWVLGEAYAMPPAQERRLCLLEGAEAGWMDVFLRPAIEAAGYRVTMRVEPGQHAAVSLAMEDDPPADAAVPRIALARTRGQGLYRYDRAGLLAAMADSVRRRV